MMEFFITSNDKVQNPSESKDYFAVLQRKLKRLNFEFCSFEFFLPYPISNPIHYRINNFPKSWQHKYLQQRLELNDPIIKRGIVNTQHFIWNDRLFADSPEFRALQLKSKIKYGVSQSVHHEDGSISICSIARSIHPIYRKELQSKQVTLSNLLNQSCHDLALRLAGENRSHRMKLSGREIQILTWTADGKTAEETAMILHLSTRTVNFHIAKVIDKLGVSNKTAATVKAARLGLISCSLNYSASQTVVNQGP